MLKVLIVWFMDEKFEFVFDYDDELFGQEMGGIE